MKFNCNSMKFNFNSMKFNCNSMKFNFNSMKFNFNSMKFNFNLIKIQFQFNENSISIQWKFNFNSIKFNFNSISIQWKFNFNSISIQCAKHFGWDIRGFARALPAILANKMEESLRNLADSLGECSRLVSQVLAGSSSKWERYRFSCTRSIRK